MPLDCSICMDVLVKTGLIISTTPCAHIFHTECISEWINKCENGANCPVCRRTFPASEVVQINAVTDEDITAVAKAISEQVTLKNESRPVSQPAAPFVPYDDYHESDSSDDYYEEEPQSDIDDYDEILDTVPVDLECDDFEDPDELIGIDDIIIGDNDSIDLDDFNDDIYEDVSDNDSLPATVNNSFDDDFEGNIPIDNDSQSDDDLQFSDNTSVASNEDDVSVGSGGQNSDDYDLDDIDNQNDTDTYSEGSNGTDNDWNDDCDYGNGDSDDYSD